MKPEVGSCPFCRIRAGLEEAEFVATPGIFTVFAIKPLNPVTPGHTLVIPNRHVTDATEDPLLFGIVCDTAASLAKSLFDSANIITSIGEPATQTVKHLHVHVVPRRYGDGLALPWSDGLLRHPTDALKAQEALDAD